MNPIPTADSNKYIARDFFTYECVTVTTLAPAGNQTLSVTIDSDGDFFWTKGCVYADIANDAFTDSTRPIPALTVLITDGTTQRNMSNVPVAVNNLFGTGSLPFILPVAKYFAARSLITLTVYNISDNATYTSLRFSLHGVKAYLRG
jgi:hypothetical protein